MLNGCSVKAAFSFPTSATAFLFSPHVQQCVLVSGAVLDMLRMVILRQYNLHKIVCTKYVLCGFVFWNSHVGCMHWLLWHMRTPIRVCWLIKPGIRYSNPRLPVNPELTLTLTCQDPYPWERVRVCPGKGTGSPGKPQGYPRQSLTSTNHA